jgi:hypothetical protein
VVVDEQQTKDYQTFLNVDQICDGMKCMYCTLLNSLYSVFMLVSTKYACNW